MERAHPAGVRALAGALLVSAAIVVGSPYIGQVRAAVQSRLPEQYRAIVIGVVAAGVLTALAVAVFRIRERRAVRYALLVTALVMAALFARLTRTGNVEQDLIEQFHFVEFGVLTYLFYRVWRRCDDARALILPACAALTVGIADEWFQWFVPSRVGEFHDVLINGVAVVCGLVFSAGVEPPSIRKPLDGRARKAIAVGGSAVCVAIAVFLETVHRGHMIAEADVGRFRSAYTRAELEAASAERAMRWRTAPPPGGEGIAREDHYLSEGRWHIQRRNEARDTGDLWTAWNENLILEKYFEPVLDLGARWAAHDRTALAASSVARVNGYVSDAEPYPILIVSASRLWLTTGCIIAILWLAIAGRRKRVSGAARV